MKKTLLTLSTTFVFLLLLGLASTAFAHGKQTIRHKPPGNRGNEQVITVSCHAVDAHIAQHEDEIVGEDTCLSLHEVVPE
jgi:hypothetical protein